MHRTIFQNELFDDMCPSLKVVSCLPLFRARLQMLIGASINCWQVGTSYSTGQLQLLDRIGNCLIDLAIANHNDYQPTSMV